MTGRAREIVAVDPSRATARGRRIPRLPEPAPSSPLSDLWQAVRAAVVGLSVLGFTAAAQPNLAEVDREVIRLQSAAPASEEADTEDLAIEEPRKGFEFGSFESRLESLWFQRKTFMATGRERDAATQLTQLQSFCAEEGVKRLEPVAGALLAESRRDLEEGRHDQALSAIEFAGRFDPGNPQVHRARAAALWQSGGGLLAAGVELARAFKSALLRSVIDLSLFHRLTVVAVLATLACLVAFAILMVLRYQIVFRHEIEEWAGHSLEPHWASALSWAALALPLVLWIGAGWVVLYWIVIMFRFMTRGERSIASTLLLAGALVVPAQRVAIALYGTTADPAYRTALASADGSYDPDRIVKLRQLVSAHPEDPVYHFLLAGLYKNGRFFEEAFAEYKQTLELDPAFEAAFINIGNIFHATGQYSEAVNNYRRALELDGRSVLALFNMHLAQSEAFHFTDAEDSLTRARDIDSDRVAELLAPPLEASRPTVRDAVLGPEALWKATLYAGNPLRGLRGREEPSQVTAGTSSLLLPGTSGFLVALVGCAALLLLGRGQRPAGRCIRCGQPFCQICQSERETKEYCSQCLHLFVLGDGLAARSKSRKLYEVEQHERRTRGGRKLASLLLPGAGHLLRGRPGRGTLLMLAWLGAWIAWQPAVLAPAELLTGARLHLELLQPPAVPTYFAVHPLALLGLISLPAIWCLGNLSRRRRREA